MAIPNWKAGTPSTIESGPARAMSGLTLTGAEKLQAVLMKLGERAPEAMGEALYRQAEFIMTKSKQQVPVDTGNLRATGHVGFPIVQGPSVFVQLGYGGTAGDVTSVRTAVNKQTGSAVTKVTMLSDDVGYAVIVHENLRAHHPVGKAKYLEDPMLEAAGGLEGKLAADLTRTHFSVKGA